MQCNDCDKIYLAENEEQLCPKCGGTGTVLIDITGEFYPNRATRRRAKSEKVGKYLPCPECYKVGNNA